MKKLLFVLAMVIGSTSVAANQPLVDVSAIQRMSVSQVAIKGILNWKVGERLDYKLTLGFFPGTMSMVVREEVTEGFWLDQDASIFGQQQKIEMLVSSEDGSILQLIVNGEKQEPPANGGVEVVEMKEEKVTVPAGTFDVIYAKLKDKNSGEITEAWINPEIIPISGMAKTVANSQMGQVTMELTKFLKK